MSNDYLFDNRTEQQYRNNVSVSKQIQDEYLELFQYQFDSEGYEATFTTVGCDANGLLYDYSQVTSEPDWELTLTLGEDEVTVPIEFQYSWDYHDSYFFKENKVNRCLDRGATIVLAINRPGYNDRVYAITNPVIISEYGQYGMKYQYGQDGGKTGYYLDSSYLMFHRLDDHIDVWEWLQ